MKTLPKEFIERMQGLLGDEQFIEFENSLNSSAPTSIRINAGKLNGKLNLEKVQWCDTGYYLPERPLFVADPLWHAGAYYVQEASSMAIEQAFVAIREKHVGQLMVLDLCAAPGGKSTHIASLLSDDDVLVSNEVIKSRVSVLNENMTKWGYPNTIVTNADSRDFEQCGKLFDVIVVDAPCSGEGLFRKDDNAIKEWSIANTELCSLRQKRILDQVVNCLKPGGFIIYSTCTYNPDENASQVNTLLKQGFSPVEFKLNGKINYMHQCYPHQITGEGFFMALLEKNEDIEKENKQNKTASLKPVKNFAEFRNFITIESSFYEFRNHIIAVNENVRELYENISAYINCYSIGTSVCEKNDRLVVPSPYLPFSSIFNSSNFEIRSIEYAEALNYLGNQALQHQSIKKGYAAIQYKGVNLGFGKLAGNRINNLFPNEWRLRRTVKTQEYFTILSYL